MEFCAYFMEANLLLFQDHHASSTFSAWFVVWLDSNLCFVDFPVCSFFFPSWEQTFFFIWSQQFRRKDAINLSTFSEYSCGKPFYLYSHWLIVLLNDNRGLEKFVKMR